MINNKKHRTHTFYMKNLDKNHPLKVLYINANNLKPKHLDSFTQWKHDMKAYSDNYPTNTHIIFK